VFASCGDKDLLELDKVNGAKNMTPSYSVPVAYGSYTAWDLVKQADSDLLSYDDNTQLISINYRNDDIYRLNANDVLDIPENIVNLTIAVETPSNPLLSSVEISLPEDVKVENVKEVAIDFDYGELKKLSGSLQLNYACPALPFNYTFRVSIPALKYIADGTPVEIFQEISKGQQNKGTIDLENIVFDMSAKPNTFNYEFEFVIPKGQNVDVNNVFDKTFYFDLDFENFVYEEIEGVVRLQQPISISPDEFDMDVDFWQYFQGSFAFADPKLRLVVENYGMALPVDIDMKLTAYGDGKSMQLYPKNDFILSFNGWDGGDEPTVETGEYNVGNSNINALLSLPPKDKIEYSGSIYVNPEANDVRMISDAFINLGLEIDIPLKLSLCGVSFSDTTDNVDINADDLDKIEEASITVKAENGLPIELSSGYIYMLDANDVAIDSIVVDKFVDAPDVDANGEVVTPQESEHKITLTTRNIDHLSATKKLVISVSAYTSDKGETTVNFNADAVIKFALQLDVQLNLDDF
jgi:hypothetical protein